MRLVMEWSASCTAMTKIWFGEEAMVGEESPKAKDAEARGEKFEIIRKGRGADGKCAARIAAVQCRIPENRFSMHRCMYGLRCGWNTPCTTRGKFWMTRRN